MGVFVEEVGARYEWVFSFQSQCSVVSVQWSVFSGQFLVAVFSFRFSVFGCQFSVVSLRFSVFGFRFSVVGCRFLLTSSFFIGIELFYEIYWEFGYNFCHFFIGSRYNFAPLRYTKSLEVTVVVSKILVLQRLVKSYLKYNKYINLQPSSLRVFFKNCGWAIFKKYIENLEAVTSFFIGSRYNFAPLRYTKSLEVTVVESKILVLQRLVKSYLIYNKYINLQPTSLRVFFKNCGWAIFKKIIENLGATFVIFS